MMQMVGSFAAFERAMLRERTKAARQDGWGGGRHPKHGVIRLPNAHLNIRPPFLRSNHRCDDPDH